MTFSTYMHMSITDELYKKSDPVHLLTNSLSVYKSVKNRFSKPFHGFMI